MKRNLFGRTGLQVSVLGFGGGPIGYAGGTPDNAGKILNQLLDAGANLIDTAASYAGSEEMIGHAIGHRRDQFVLVTKCGQAFPDLQGDAWSPTVIAQAIDRSLRRLQTDHLDVVLLHSCDLATLKKGDALAALVAARQAGKIRFAGYSGDNETVAFAAALPDIAVVETSVNLLDQANIDTLLPVTRHDHTGLIVKRPLANAAWKADAQQHAAYRAYAAPYVQRLALMGLQPAALGFTGDPDLAWPEIALRFVLSIPGLHTAIVGTTNPARVAQNIAYAAKGPLPDEALKTIRQAFTNAERKDGKKWAGLT